MADGVRQYLSESGLMGIAAAAVLYLVANIVLFTVETLDGGGVLCYLQTAAAILLVAGILCTLVGARLRFSPIGIVVAGLIITAVGITVLAINEIISFFTEYSILGFIQRVVTLVFLAAVMVIIIFLMAASGRKKPLASVGAFPSVVGVVALIMLMVRTMLSFASLKSELGNAWNWALAEQESFAEVIWVLRSVPSAAPSAAKMFGVRLAERISAIILIASSLGFFFKYKGFFEHFCRNLDYIREIPVRRSYEEEEGSAEQSDLLYFGSMAGIGTRSQRRAARRDEIFDPREERYDEIYDPREERYDEIYDPCEEQYDEMYAPAGQPVQNTPQRRQLRNSAASGQPRGRADAAERQPVKVKVKPVKPSVPNPDEAGFWDTYTH